MQDSNRAGTPSLISVLEPLALALSRAMIALRNEVMFSGIGDHQAFEAAALLSSMLEDAHAEAVVLNDQLERRVAGMELR